MEKEPIDIIDGEEDNNMIIDDKTENKVKKQEEEINRDEITRAEEKEEKEEEEDINSDIPPPGVTRDTWASYKKYLPFKDKYDRLSNKKKNNESLTKEERSFLDKTKPVAKKTISITKGTVFSSCVVDFIIARQFTDRYKRLGYIGDNLKGGRLFDAREIYYDTEKCFGKIYKYLKAHYFKSRTRRKNGEIDTRFHLYKYLLDNTDVLIVIAFIFTRMITKDFTTAEMNRSVDSLKQRIDKNDYTKSDTTGDDLLREYDNPKKDIKQLPSIIAITNAIKTIIGPKLDDFNCIAKCEYFELLFKDYNSKFIRGGLKTEGGYRGGELGKVTENAKNLCYTLYRIVNDPIRFNKVYSIMSFKLEDINNITLKSSTSFIKYDMLVTESVSYLDHIDYLPLFKKENNDMDTYDNQITNIRSGFGGKVEKEDKQKEVWSIWRLYSHLDEKSSLFRSMMNKVILSKSSNAAISMYDMDELLYAVTSPLYHKSECILSFTFQMIYDLCCVLHEQHRKYRNIYDFVTILHNSLPVLKGIYKNIKATNTTVTRDMDIRYNIRELLMKDDAFKQYRMINRNVEFYTIIKDAIKGLFRYKTNRLRMDNINIDRDITNTLIAYFNRMIEKNQLFIHTIGNVDENVSIEAGEMIIDPVLIMDTKIDDEFRLRMIDFCHILSNNTYLYYFVEDLLYPRFIQSLWIYILDLFKKSFGIFSSHFVSSNDMKILREIFILPNDEPRYFLEKNNDDGDIVINKLKCHPLEKKVFDEYVIVDDELEDFISNHTEAIVITEKLKAIIIHTKNQLVTMFYPFLTNKRYTNNRDKQKRTDDSLNENLNKNSNTMYILLNRVFDDYMFREKEYHNIELTPFIDDLYNIFGLYIILNFQNVLKPTTITNTRDANFCYMRICRPELNFQQQEELSLSLCIYKNIIELIENNEDLFRFNASNNMLKKITENDVDINNLFDIGYNVNFYNRKDKSSIITIEEDEEEEKAPFNNLKYIVIKKTRYRMLNDFLKQIKYTKSDDTDIVKKSISKYLLDIKNGVDMSEKSPYYYKPKLVNNPVNDMINIVDLKAACLKEKNNAFIFIIYRSLELNGKTKYNIVNDTTYFDHSFLDDCKNNLFLISFDTSKVIQSYSSILNDTDMDNCLLKDRHVLFIVEYMTDKVYFIQYTYEEFFGISRDQLPDRFTDNDRQKIEELFKGYNMNIIEYTTHMFNNYAFVNIVLESIKSIHNKYDFGINITTKCNDSLFDYMNYQAKEINTYNLTNKDTDDTDKSRTKKRKITTTTMTTRTIRKKESSIGTTTTISILTDEEKLMNTIKRIILDEFHRQRVLFGTLKTFYKKKTIQQMNEIMSNVKRVLYNNGQCFTTAQKTKYDALLVTKEYLSEAVFTSVLEKFIESCIRETDIPLPIMNNTSYAERIKNVIRYFIDFPHLIRDISKETTEQLQELKKNNKLEDLEKLITEIVYNRNIYQINIYEFKQKAHRLLNIEKDSSYSKEGKAGDDDLDAHNITLEEAVNENTDKDLENMEIEENELYDTCKKDVTTDINNVDYPIYQEIENKELMISDGKLHQKRDSYTVEWIEVQDKQEENNDEFQEFLRNNKHNKKDDDETDDNGCAMQSFKQ